LKTLFYSDIHCNLAKPDYTEFLDRTLQALCDLIKEENPSLVICAGDVLDTFGTVDVKTLVWARRWITRITEACNGSRHVVLRGNHDTADHAGEWSSTELLGMEGVTAITSPVLLDGVSYVPHTSDVGAVLAFLSECSKTKVEFVVSHLDWVGVHMTPDYVSKSGLSVEAYTRIMGKTPVFNGHYHMPLDSPPLRVIGAPLYKDFSDVESKIPRGFLLYDSYSKQVRRVENSHTYHTYSVTVEKESDLEQLKDLPKTSRVKVYAPSALLDKVKESCEGFLWSSSHPTDSAKQAVGHTVEVSVKTPAVEVVEKALAKVGTGFNKDKLRLYGEESFGIAQARK
jgi:predicted phosphodiesterase